ncbi:MAG: hypothetical protein L0H79_21520 [Intrasporangium sp.]|uniref:hypothetical protein n=1 Tax=Intrasporangium sp. TaxID=1925024 RepID=UPI00264A3D6C|nr:hypothetical protein [Intrasporangium sp.]MDN5798308.1 hypothetical protein [Intrasporangium sp.]
MSELKPRRARANAFDLNRTDRDDVDPTFPTAPLSDLLPRTADQTPAKAPSLHRSPTRQSPSGAPAAAPPAAAPSPLRTVPDLPGPAEDEGSSLTPVDEPRGVGGRPPLTKAGSSRITTTAARVPIELYDNAEDLVKGRGKPSWGQLIAWTCTSRQEDVVNEVLTLTEPAPGLVPRGQNKRGTASTQITARFTHDEHATFTRTRDLAQTGVETAEHPIEGPVTATLVVIAALRVATTSS